MNDQRLLKEYATNGSEQAFAELTQRYLRLVYSTCRRELGDAQLAEDAAQAVFILLARKASTLARGNALGGWLFQTSVLTARNVRRSELRRRVREEWLTREAMRMQTYPPSADETVGRSLNDALASLKPVDREAVMLRYISGHTLGETGVALGITEDGARKRIERALSKLQRFLTGQGVVLGAGGVVFLLERHSEAAPVHLVDAVLHIGTTGGVAATLAGTSAVTIAQGALRTMMLMKAAAVVGVGIIVTGGVVAGSKLVAAMQPFASWPAPVGRQAVNPPSNAVPAPARIQTVVAAVDNGDVADILPTMTPEVAALFTPGTVKSFQAQAAPLGRVTQIGVTSQTVDGGAVDYKFKTYYANGTVDGEMAVDPQGKINLLSFTPDIILAPAVPFDTLVKRTIDGIAAGDEPTLASLSDSSMSSVLSGGSLDLLKSQLNGYGTIENITIDKVDGGHQMVSCRFTVDMTKGRVVGRLAENSEGKIVMLELRPAGD